MLKSYIKIIKKEDKVVNKEELKHIKIVENSNLSIHDKKELLLVYLGEKPALWFPAEDDFSENNTEEKEDVLKRISKMRANIKNTVEKLVGIFYEIEDFEIRKEDGRIKKGFNFIAGHDQKKLNNLKKSFDNPSSRTRGIALGYPKSSVEGYLNDEIFEFEEYLGQLKEDEKKELEETLKFAGFSLSKDNWKEELKIVKRYQQKIKAKSPKIYKEIVKR